MRQIPLVKDNATMSALQTKKIPKRAKKERPPPPPPPPTPPPPPAGARTGKAGGEIRMESASLRPPPGALVRPNLCRGPPAWPGSPCRLVYNGEGRKLRLSTDVQSALVQLVKWLILLIFALLAPAGITVKSARKTFWLQPSPRCSELVQD